MISRPRSRNGCGSRGEETRRAESSSREDVSAGARPESRRVAEQEQAVPLVYRSLRFGFQRRSEYTSPSRGFRRTRGVIMQRRGDLLPLRMDSMNIEWPGDAPPPRGMSRARGAPLYHASFSMGTVADRHVIHPFSITCIYGRDPRATSSTRLMHFAGLDAKHGATRRSIEISADKQVHCVCS